MKYNININQLALKDTKLDLRSAAILDYLWHICASRNPKIESARIKDPTGDWTWVNYTALITDMPLLRLNSISPISDRIQAIKNENFIEIRRQGNQNLYVRFTGEADKLFVSANSSVRIGEQLSNKENESNKVLKGLNEWVESGKTCKKAVRRGERIIDNDTSTNSEVEKSTSQEVSSLSEDEVNPVEITTSEIDSFGGVVKLKPKKIIKSKIVDERVRKVIEIWNRYPTASILRKGKVPNSTAEKNLLPLATKNFPLEKRIKDQLRFFPEITQWERAIKKYVEDVINRQPDNSYAVHRFSLYDFVNQKNGINKFANK